MLSALTKGVTVSAQALDLFYQVPPFLLPIYQAAAVQYGVPWEVLAAINEVETDYGNDLSVSTAGRVGWMQFMPQTWLQYGVDALDAGYADPYNPVDAIFAAARYLAAAGASQNLRTAVFAYNHSEAYVESVLLRARLLASYPPSVIATLTGLVEGSPPLHGAHVVAELAWTPAPSRSGREHPARAAPRRLPSPTPGRRTTSAGEDRAHRATREREAARASRSSTRCRRRSSSSTLEGPANAPVVAVQNGRIVALGHSPYSSATTWRWKTSTAMSSPTPTSAASPRATSLPSRHALQRRARRPPPRPSQTAAGADARARPGERRLAARRRSRRRPPRRTRSQRRDRPRRRRRRIRGNVPSSTGKVLMFAHPENPDARAAAARFAAARAALPEGLGPLRVGAVVSQGVTLGCATRPSASSHTGSLRFAIRPAGDSSASTRARSCRTGTSSSTRCIPQGAKGNSGLVGATASDVFLLSQSELERAVLADPGIELPDLRAP